MNFANLETTIKSYESEKAQKIAAVKERATREKIVPFNTEIEEKKRTNAETVIATETAAVSVEYDEFISELNAILSKMKQ